MSEQPLSPAEEKLLVSATAEPGRPVAHYAAAANVTRRKAYDLLLRLRFRGLVTWESGKHCTVRPVVSGEATTGTTDASLLG